MHSCIFLRADPRGRLRSSLLNLSGCFLSPTNPLVLTDVKGRGSDSHFDLKTIVV